MGLYLESILQSSWVFFYIKGLMMEWFESESLPVIRDSSMKCLYIGAMVKASFSRVCRGMGSNSEEYVEVK